MLNIVRYKNRKLYNLTGKSYITLLELGRKIRDGEVIIVVDKESGDNITALTLAQILIEQIRHVAYAPDFRQIKTPDEQKAELAVRLHGMLREFTPRLLDEVARDTTD